MKRFLAVFLVAVMLLSLSGCDISVALGQRLGQLLMPQAPDADEHMENTPATDANDEQPAEASYLSADYAESALLHSGNYDYLIADEDDEYGVYVAFYAHGTVENVAFYRVSYGDGYDIWEPICQWERVDRQKPLVVQMTFPGDMSCYGVTYTDSHGLIRYYQVYMSGLDGSLLLTQCSEEPYISN